MHTWASKWAIMIHRRLSQIHNMSSPTYTELIKAVTFPQVSRPKLYIHYSSVTRVTCSSPALNHLQVSGTLGNSWSSFIHPLRFSPGLTLHSCYVEKRMPRCVTSVDISKWCDSCAIICYLTFRIFIAIIFTVLFQSVAFRKIPAN